MQLNGRKHWGLLQDREGRTCSEMTGRVGDWQTDNRKKMCKIEREACRCLVVSLFSGYSTKYSVNNIIIHPDLVTNEL